MSVHHFITEENIIEEAKCPYCQTRIARMESTHHFNMQYRETVCQNPKCKRKIQVRVGEGSGDDDFNIRLRENANRKDLDGVIEEE